MKKKYQVFISSTYTDLIDERNAAIQCLLDNDCIPVGMEQFPASNMSQMEYIKKMLDDCDYYILILGGRYGTLDDDGISYTEKEYDYALSKKIPVMSFVFINPENLPNKNCETTDIMREKFISFRKKVCEGHLVKFHSDVGSLKANIVTSMNHCIKDFPAVGWVRGNELTKTGTLVSLLESKIDQLSLAEDERIIYTQRIKKLEEELNSKQKISITEIPNEAGGITVIIGGENEFERKSFIEEDWMVNELDKL